MLTIPRASGSVQGPPRVFVPFADFWLERELERYAVKVEHSIRDLDHAVVAAADIVELSERFVAETYFVPPSFDFDTITEALMSRHVPLPQFPGRAIAYFIDRQEEKRRWERAAEGVRRIDRQNTELMRAPMNLERAAPRIE